MTTQRHLLRALRTSCVSLGLAGASCSPAPTANAPARPTATPAQPAETVASKPERVEAPAEADVVDAPTQPDIPHLRIEGTPTAAVDPARLECTGTAPTPGQALRDVNLCDLLVEDTRRKLDKPATFVLESAVYSDIRPTWSSHDATLCEGEEAVLTVQRTRSGITQECIQLRCASNFPPDALRVGKNGEFCRSSGTEFERWSLRPGVVQAVYPHARETWRLRGVGEDYDYERRRAAAAEFTTGR